MLEAWTKNIRAEKSKSQCPRFTMVVVEHFVVTMHSIRNMRVILLINIFMRVLYLYCFVVQERICHKSRTPCIDI